MEKHADTRCCRFCVCKCKEHAIEIFTYVSNNEQGVGSGIAICIKNKLTHQIRHKLHDRCSNNQAEQIAIVKALQAIETIKINNNIQRKIMIHADSRIPLESLQNMKNRKHHIEEIRKKTISTGEGKLERIIHMDKSARRALWKRTRKGGNQEQ
jgi:ribonuclease HI